MNFIILSPVLTCPRLVQEGDFLEILVLARSDDVDLSSLTYSAWKTKKKKSFDKKDIEILPYVPEHHISPFVMSTYEREGFNKIVRARISLQVKKGLYQLNNPEDIGISLKEIEPPFSCPSLPDGCSVSSFLSEEPVRLHHPFYVDSKDYLTVAHVSDSHVCARMSLLEERWNSNFRNVWSASSLLGEKPGDFSNYNKHFENILKSINADKEIDIIIHTGDIIDYNRGYYDKEKKNDLSHDYYFNRNWLLFYEILCNSYEKPTFTVLGNHDYRLNPYAPSPHIISDKIFELFNMAPTVNVTRREMDVLHEDAHALHLFENHLITTPDSAQWYSLVMNPFLDYEVFYGKMAFLMLDWNEDEDHEKDTPWAAKVLSDEQWNLIKRWHEKVMEKRKQEKITAIVAMHASVFNPFREMGDRELEKDETRIFYESNIFDRYSVKKDLVDGTFRHKRSEFIRMCLGNEEYGINNYKINPEWGVDLILTGHAHRSGVFQVEGPHVYLRKTFKEGPLFCNGMTSGPLGFENEEGGWERAHLALPGYHVVTTGEISVDVKTSDLVVIRKEARRSYGEIARGEGFEVEDEFIDLPGMDIYHWKVTNLKEGSTITRVTIRLKSPVEVSAVPLGWRSFTDGSILVCGARDRGQGIFYKERGEIHVRVSTSVEKLGNLTVSWDMSDDQSPPVKVKVPG